MEPDTLDALIRKAMACDAMDIPEPGLEIVKAARNTVIVRKKHMQEKSGFNNWFFMVLKGRLKFYQVGFSVLVTCLCLFYSVEISVDSRNSHGFSNYSVNSLSIKNSTVSVNSSTILTSIPTLRN